MKKAIILLTAVFGLGTAATFAADPTPKPSASASASASGTKHHAAKKHHGKAKASPSPAAQ